MKAVIQRVSAASVAVGDRICGQIGTGLLVFAGLEKGDQLNDLDRLARKITGLRVFEDDGGRMNRSVVDVNGDILLVSQFTIAGSIEKGRRPSFDRAMDPAQAEPLFEAFVEMVRECGVHVETGEFGAMMAVSLVNQGPATFLYDREPGS